MTLHIDAKYIRLISLRLRNFKQKSDYLWNFSCPLCGDSKKNLSKARGYAFQKGNNLFYRCHNCGAGTNLNNLLKSVDPSLHGEYVLERYKSGETNTQDFKFKTINIIPPKFDKVAKTKVFEYGEWCDKLPDGHFCLNYIQKRQLPKECFNMLLFTDKYRQFVSSLVPDLKKVIYNDARLVIPYYNRYNELVAVSGRALETSDTALRYVTVRTNDSQDKLIYGIDRVNLSEVVKIVEGPIDSLFLKNCVASGDASLTITANDIDCQETVLIFDNERRNPEILKLMNSAIKMNHSIVIWPDSIAGKDINEMVMSGISPDEIEDIISTNTFSGLQALTKFTFWKKI